VLLFYPSDTLTQVPKITGGQPLLYIGGKEVPIDSLKTLNPQRIESIQVLRDSSASKTYGEKARNGVVLVTLKHEQN
jgi:TonB-dependent SusC/RagA subfamily outer membrane receptor